MVLSLSIYSPFLFSTISQARCEVESPLSAVMVDNKWQMSRVELER